MPRPPSVTDSANHSTGVGDRPDCAVLVVDDENGVREILGRWLQRGGYTVATAAGAAEALDLMQSAPPAVALCDIRMPGRDGLWLADRIRRQFPETAVIMATGVHDAVAAAASLGDGVVDYLTKPFGCERLREAVQRGVEWHKAARDTRWWRAALEAEVDHRRRSVAQTIAGMRIETDAALQAMFSTLTDGNRQASAHGQRVAVLAEAIATRMGLAASHIATIRRAALLHDLGKLALPEALLRKPAPLSGEERAVVRRYPELGADLMGPLPYLAEVATIVASTQERPDGRGYPVGTSDPPLASRIVAAADAYDTMTRPRVYRDALSASEALLELERGAGTQFDPKVVDVLRGVVTAA